MFLSRTGSADFEIAQTTVQLVGSLRTLDALDGRISKPKFLISGTETISKPCVTSIYCFMIRANCKMISTNRRGERIVTPAYILMLTGEPITLQWNLLSGTLLMRIVRHFSV